MRPKEVDVATLVDQEKYAAAAESLTKAAEANKACGSNNDAGRAYQRAAEIQKDKLKNPVDASK